MPSENNIAPSHMVCAKCGKLMRLLAIEPSVLGADEITYRCPFCDHDEKRIRKADKV
jgi:Zn finger protein HypA/HybF involved in hydrogenase expression